LQAAKKKENTMGILICAALLLAAWVAFVFSRYNPDRRIMSGSVQRPLPKRAPIAGTDNHRRQLHNPIRRAES
jgi:hypothetical protein